MVDGNSDLIKETPERALDNQVDCYWVFLKMETFTRIFVRRPQGHPGGNLVPIKHSHFNCEHSTFLGK